MSKIAIVTDSTSFLPKALKTQYALNITPLVVIWDNQHFHDGVDIQPDDFYQRLKTAKTMPSTSQVAVGVMKETFEKLVQDGYDEVLGIFLSSKLSGTIDSAQQAKDMMGADGAKVTLFDSLSTSMEMGFMVLAAARALEGGAALAECLKLLEEVRDNSGVYFALDTLEFLHRGGRIGGAARFIGSALNLKPILTLAGGKVEALERIRTKTKAQERLIDIVAEKVQGKKNVRLATIHANAREEAEAVLARAAERLNPVESYCIELSPVIGTHTGPGTVGLAYSTD